MLVHRLAGGLRCAGRRLAARSLRRLQPGACVIEAGLGQGLGLACRVNGALRHALAVGGVELGRRRPMPRPQFLHARRRLAQRIIRLGQLPGGGGGFADGQLSLRLVGLQRAPRVLRSAGGGADLRRQRRPLFIQARMLADQPRDIVLRIGQGPRGRREILGQMLQAVGCRRVIRPGALCLLGERVRLHPPALQHAARLRLTLTGLRQPGLRVGQSGGGRVVFLLGRLQRCFRSIQRPARRFLRG